jgi:murein DD-endopeptidase MepM/ murein hydrolase activator NlpD
MNLQICVPQPSIVIVKNPDELARIGKAAVPAAGRCLRGFPRAAACGKAATVRRHSPVLPAVLPILLLAACATPQPPRQTTPTAKPQPGKGVPPAPRRWQAVPARADGTAVPGGRQHIVKRGETGIAIANAYKVPWSRIAAANRLDRDAVLQVGQALFVPTATQTTAAARPRPGARPARQEPSTGFQLDLDDLVTGSAPAREGPAGQTVPARAPAAPAAQAGIPPLAWPVDGRVILSRYGPKPGGRVNDGVNIKTVRGSPVRAAASGEVIYVGEAISGFGLMLLVRHPGGTVTAYAHLEDALADRGDRVERGQPIGRAGASGSATEPQLHFQLRQGRRTLDPLLYLPR